jgi:hypothetical protein
MSPAHHPFRLPAAIIIGLGVAYVVGTVLIDHVPHAVAPVASSHLHTSEQASISSKDGPVQLYKIAVPESTPESILSAREQTIKQGDVVEFVVTSRRPGTVVVHGLTDERRVVANAQLSMQFRAIYSGRFALHFHGDDGSHFELMALNVMPAP